VHFFLALRRAPAILNVSLNETQRQSRTEAEARTAEDSQPMRFLSAQRHPLILPHYGV